MNDTFLAGLLFLLVTGCIIIHPPDEDTPFTPTDSPEILSYFDKGNPINPFDFKFTLHEDGRYFYTVDIWEEEERRGGDHYAEGTLTQEELNEFKQRLIELGVFDDTAPLEDCRTVSRSILDCPTDIGVKILTLSFDGKEREFQWVSVSNAPSYLLYIKEKFEQWGGPTQMFISG